ncbi:MAG: lysylphosphatidylglycerol synthase transmembrane domain-containing protein [Anaerolineaceae bacterium]
MTRSQNSISAKNIFKRMVPAFLFGFLILVALSFLGDISKIASTIQNFNWKVFPLVICFTLFNYSLRFIKWHFYITQMGIKDFPIIQSARLFVAGFPLAMTPGKIGEILKGVWLKQLTGISIPKGISIIVAERISDGLAVLFLSTLGVLAYPQYWPVFILVLVVLLSIIVISQIRPLAYWFFELSEKIPIIKKFTGTMRDLYEGSVTVFRPETTLFAVFLGMISWFGEGVGFYLILINLGLPVGKETLANAVFILSFSTIIGAVSALPGGLGAAEVSIAGMLTLLVGMESSLASVATLLIRFATLWFGVALGLLTWLFSLEFFGFKGKKNEFIEGRDPLS